MMLPRRSGSTWSLGDRQFNYEAKFDGGGLYFAPFLLRYLARHSLHFERAIEVCAGLGFLGLSILYNEFTDSLLLTDINPEVRALVDFEDYMLTNMLDNVQGPVDLIVGNLPYFPTSDSFRKVAKMIDVDEQIYLDPEWALHRIFFAQARNLISSKGLLIFFGHKDEDVFNEVSVSGFKLRDIVPCWEGRQMIVLEKK